jgi:RNA recognition motif-containing protein
MSEVPPGTWFFIKNIPIETTDEELAQHFCESGIATPPENVSVRHYPERATAIVSVSKEEICALEKWAVNQRKSKHCDLIVQLFGTSRGVKRDNRY